MKEGAEVAGGGGAARQWATFEFLGVSSLFNREDTLRLQDYVSALVQIAAAERCINPGQPHGPLPIPDLSRLQCCEVLALA